MNAITWREDMQRHFETNCHQKSDLKPNYLPLYFHTFLPSYGGVDHCELCYSLREIPKFSPNFLVTFRKSIEVFSVK